MSLMRLLAALLSMLVLVGLAIAQDAPTPEGPADPPAVTDEAADDTATEPDPAAEGADDPAEVALSEPLVEAAPAGPLPEPLNVRVVDNPADETTLGLTWEWSTPPLPGVTVKIEAQPSSEILGEYELNEAERNRLSNGRQQLRDAIADLLPERDSLRRQLSDAQLALTQTQTTLGDDPDEAALTGLKEARQHYWVTKVALDGLQKQIDGHRDAFLAQTNGGRLAEKQRQYEYLSAAISAGQYLATDGVTTADSLDKVGDRSDVFGRGTDGAEDPFLEASMIVVPAPGPLADDHDEYDEQSLPQLTFDLQPDQMYVLRLAVSQGDSVRYTDVGGAQPQLHPFNRVLSNGLILAVVFALIILAAIALARRNPNLFIRRIAGLEAVDEAIGRATEMGKPVLYLNGMNDLTDLSTLAAVNILGRVAQRIASFDSSLLVPCRDPVVMTVAQEVVRSGYMDAGRPDAYREDNVFFVTQDQFSYTATTCGIMLREKPAANFFMGYYYAESLLLAETGQSTGAIQIAGTDSQNQLPFFITTCDYTLIGEELYAASAYLSREPLLLGSLKGLDVAKLVVIIALVVQTALFLVSPEIEFIRMIFQPR